MKIKEYENNNENLKIYINEKNQKNLIELNFDEKIKKIIEEYENNLKNYNNFFNESFQSNIFEIIENESFIFKNNEERENLNNCIIILCNNIKENNKLN
jgi:hypothetical protein